MQLRKYSWPHSKWNESVLCFLALRLIVIKDGGHRKYDHLTEEIIYHVISRKYSAWRCNIYLFKNILKLNCSVLSKWNCPLYVMKFIKYVPSIWRVLLQMTWKRNYHIICKENFAIIIIKIPDKVCKIYQQNIEQDITSSTKPHIFSARCPRRL